MVYGDTKKGQMSFSTETKVDFNYISQKSENLSLKLKNYLKNKNEVIPQVLICKEILKDVENDAVRDFLLLALSGTISDVARRTSEQFINVFKERVNNLYLRIFLFAKLNEVLKINLGKSKSHIGDTRNMKEIIASNSIDGIVTSPPYSVALDYIKNDFPQLVLLELTDSIEKLEANDDGKPKSELRQGEVLFEKMEKEANHCNHIRNSE